MNLITRRRFIQTTAATALAAPLASRVASAADAHVHVACNHFCWINMYRRQGKNFNADLDAGFAEVKRFGNRRMACGRNAHTKHDGRGRIAPPQPDVRGRGLCEAFVAGVFSGNGERCACFHWN